MSKTRIDVEDFDRFARLQTANAAALEAMQRPYHGDPLIMPNTDSKVVQRIKDVQKSVVATANAVTALTEAYKENLTS